MNFEFLRKIGLTEGEIKVYLALLRLGEATSGNISRESGVSKSKVYDILERLISKGLAGHVVRNGVRYFTSSDPSAVMDYLERKEKELEDTKRLANAAIPSLLKQRSASENRRRVEVYEGFRGLKAIRGELVRTLKKGDELLVLGAPKIANEKWEAYFLNFHRCRENRGVGMRIIYNNDARAFGEKRKRFKRTRVRYLPGNLVSPNWFDVYGQAVLIVVILDEPVSIVVRDASLAKSFKYYFDTMWESSEE